MFDMFKRKKNDKSISHENTLPAYIAVRSYYGIARHILPTKEQTALCGYTDYIRFSDTGLTVQGVSESLPNQHKGHFWCYSCASIFTGASEEEVIGWRD